MQAEIFSPVLGFITEHFFSNFPSFLKNIFIPMPATANNINEKTIINVVKNICVIIFYSICPTLTAISANLLE